MVMHSKGTEAFIEVIGDAVTALEKAVSVLHERQLGAPKLEQQVTQLRDDTDRIYDTLIEKGLIYFKRETA